MGPKPKTIEVIDRRTLIEALAIRLLWKDRMHDDINERAFEGFKREQNEALVEELFDLGYQIAEHDFERIFTDVTDPDSAIFDTSLMKNTSYLADKIFDRRLRWHRRQESSSTEDEEDVLENQITTGQHRRQEGSAPEEEEEVLENQNTPGQQLAESLMVDEGRLSSTTAVDATGSSFLDTWNPGDGTFGNLSMWDRLQRQSWSWQGRTQQNRTNLSY